MQTNLSSRGSITCSLSIRQVISADHIAWDLIEIGDLEGMKHLLVTGQLSIDARNYGNQGLLNLSIMIGNAASTRFLVQMGADVSESHPSQSPQKQAWDRILNKMWSSEWRDDMRLLFPDPDFDDLYEFTLLHKAVLGLTSRSIESVVCGDPSLLDRADSSSRTPLTWAAWGGNDEATQKLLTYKPDLNKADSLGNSPLNYAARRSTKCTYLLLQAGADIHTRNAHRATVLHVAIQSAFEEARSLQMVQLLVEAGADVDATNKLGEIPLVSTYYHDDTVVAEYLIRIGADPGICNNAGSNMLCHATRRNHHLLIDLLLREQQDHVRYLEEESTYMHLCASFADAESLRLLSRGELGRRDINVKNGAGLTPMQVAMQRKNADTEWREAFLNFLGSIDKDQPPPYEDFPQELETPLEVFAPSSEEFDTRSISSNGDAEFEKEYEDALEVQV